MSTRRWKGTALAVKQETELTPANVEIGDIFTVTINNNAVSFTATAATVTNVTAGLADAMNDSTLPEFQELAAVDQTTKILVQAGTAGVPFMLTASATNGGAADTQTLTANTTQAATGPWHFDNAANWSGGTVPVGSDDVYFDTGDVPCLYGLSQSAITLTSLNILSGYKGKIGLKEENDSGYFEYRDTYLAISATTVNIGGGLGNGSQRIKLDTGSNQTALNVQNSGQGEINGVPALLWKGTHASNEVNVNKGQVGGAFFASESATIVTLRIGFKHNVLGDSVVKLGAGCTLTTINKTGGDLEVNSGFTTLTQNDGTTVINAGAATTLNVRGGQCVPNGTGTITTANVSGDGHLDFSQDMRAKTVTNPINRYGNDSSISDPFQVVSSMVIDLEESKDLTRLDIGTHIKVTRGAPS